ncbi:peptidase inhibitor family I36 protein [Streptomyces violaceus]|uniref:peptidase inhibitor family I36 protein n=1 Tax=Streptomyces violaceus TaxID=1936 RepID=UPI00382EF558
MRAAAIAALVLASMAIPASASPAPGAVRAPIDCPYGYVCIYPEIDFGGQPWVRRAVDGSVKDLPSAIRDRGSSIHDLRGYNLNDQTRSLKINRNDCGWPPPPPTDRARLADSSQATKVPHERRRLAEEGPRRAASSGPLRHLPPVVADCSSVASEFHDGRSCRTWSRSCPG